MVSEHTGLRRWTGRITQEGGGVAGRYRREGENAAGGENAEAAAISVRSRRKRGDGSSGMVVGRILTEVPKFDHFQFLNLL